jgi:hypothetical protein
MRGDRSDESRLSPDDLRMRMAIERRLFPPDPPMPWYRRRTPPWPVLWIATLLAMSIAVAMQ